MAYNGLAIFVKATKMSWVGKWEEQYKGKAMASTISSGQEWFQYVLQLQVRDIFGNTKIKAFGFDGLYPQQNQLLRMTTCF